MEEVQKQQGKKTYHLCLSSANEVMFRSCEDYYKAYNYYAMALYKTQSTSLADAFMSNHFHVIVRTEDPKALMYHFRNSYSKYFNNKYSRSGRLGEKKHYCIEINGLYHHLSAISYVLRNPMHHGVAPTPFAYEHSSSNIIFQRDMGKIFSYNLLSPKQYYKYIGKWSRYHHPYPPSYKMDVNGMFTRESVTDTTYVEHLYSTARAYTYYMTRKTSEEWLNEQSKDKLQTIPITINIVEEAFIKSMIKSSFRENINNSINNTDNINTGRTNNMVPIYSDKITAKMLSCENGRSNYNKLTDIQLCKKIDDITNRKYKKESVYCLSLVQKREIVRLLISNNHNISQSQLNRCIYFNDKP